MEIQCRLAIKLIIANGLDFSCINQEKAKLVFSFVLALSVGYGCEGRFQWGPSKLHDISTEHDREQEVASKSYVTVFVYFFSKRTRSLTHLLATHPHIHTFDRINFFL